ncbi:MAG: transporter substrate-binding domain-containing protein [Lachnospiraceae bacterium]|nr:transporter substrate-binding domain-containing protein [Lachnospiraceae bacterium]
MELIKKYRLNILVPVLLLAAVLTACGKKNIQINTLEDLKGKTISTKNGTVFAQEIKENEIIKDCEIIYGPTENDAFAMMLRGKSDGFAVDNLAAQSYLHKNEGVKILGEHLSESAYGIAIRKGSPIKDEINRALQELREDGKMDELSDKWLGDNDDIKKISDEIWEPCDNPEGTIICLDNSDLDDICYRDSDENLLGLDIEMVLLIAKKMNYNVEFKETMFDDIIPNIATGAGDIGVSGISITGERKRLIDFSDPYMDASTVIMVRDESVGTLGRGIGMSIKNSFRRIFVEEDRWKELLKGIVITFLLTVGSCILGGILGSAAFLIYYTGNKIVTKAVEITNRVLTLLPVTVILMFVFYIVFAGGNGITNIIAALVTLSLIFGMYFFAVVNGAVSAENDDQRIAARAMGFSKKETLTKVLIPQAIPDIIGNLEPIIIDHIKNSSLVGYITVMDFQAVLDGIGSRTNEFTAPILISVVFYLLFEELACFVIRKANQIYSKKRIDTVDAIRENREGEKTC